MYSKTNELEGHLLCICCWHPDHQPQWISAKSIVKLVRYDGCKIRVVVRSGWESWFGESWWLVVEMYSKTSELEWHLFCIFCWHFGLQPQWISAKSIVKRVRYAKLGCAKLNCEGFEPQFSRLRESSWFQLRQQLNTIKEPEGQLARQVKPHVPPP